MSRASTNVAVEVPVIEKASTLEAFRRRLVPSDVTRTVAIYGKGGIGKSTTTVNVAAAASVLGLSTMVVGCDPKADSIQALVRDGDKKPSTVLESIRKRGTTLSSVQECVYKGFNDITCVESGGPIPGVGCAGKGVAVALELLRDYKLFDSSLKLILFDVLGDVVCGGFAQPMRANFAKEVYVVTSGEFMSVYQAVNIASSIARMAKDGLQVRMAGLICNRRNVAGEDEIVSQLSELIHVPVVMTVPRSTEVQKAEAIGKTVVEACPGSELAKAYYELATKIYNNMRPVIPTVGDPWEILAAIKQTIEKWHRPV